MTQKRLLSIVTFGVASSVVNFACLKSLAMEQHELKVYWNTDDRHPILPVRAGQSIPNIALSPTVFRQLNNYDPFFKPDWSVKYGKSEIQAAQQFCKFSIGKNISQISATVGLPNFQGFSTRESQGRQEFIQVFTLGGDEVPVRLTFYKNVCTKAVISSEQKGLIDIKNFHGDVTMLHPILGFKAYELASNTKYSFPVFRAMKNYGNRAVVYRSQWLSKFDSAEKSVATQFCAVAKGKTQKQIENVTGVPTYKGIKSDCWKAVNANDQYWLYDFGIQPHVAVLTFRKGVCTATSLCSSQELSHYRQWRLNSILKHSLHKSTSEILRKQGLPNYSYVSERSNSISPATKVARKRFEYVVGPAEQLNLELINDACVNVSRDLSAY